MAPEQAAAPVSAATAAKPRQFVLPVLVFGLPEVKRLRRELEALDGFIAQAALRQPGRQPTIPKLSRLCEALASENGLNLLQAEDRTRLTAFVAALEQKAPKVHISFASDPSSAFTAKVVTWLRTSIHPHALLQVGLRPAIAAGCVVRTNSKVFDFSLREHFARVQGLLTQSLDAPSSAGQAAPQAQEVRQ